MLEKYDTFSYQNLFFFTSFYSSLRWSMQGYLTKNFSIGQIVRGSILSALTATYLKAHYDFINTRWKYLSDKYVVEGQTVGPLFYWGNVGLSITLTLPYFYFASRNRYSLFIPFLLIVLQRIKDIDVSVLEIF